MRRALQWGGSVALFCAIGWAQTERLFIGTYTNTDAHSRGIYSALFDPNTGQLSEVTPAAAIANPSFLARHPSRPFLYAVNEEREGSVSSFAIGREGELKFLGKSSTGGAAPCHLIVDRSGKWLLVANYDGGNVAVMPILPDGKAGEAKVIAFHGSGPNPRQKGPHPHEIVELAGNLVLVPDLGTDRIARYRLNPEEGTLAPADPAEIRLPPGSGPRHLAASADGTKLYVASELANTVTVFAESRIVQTVSLLPPQVEGTNTAAEIAIHPNGRYLYASLRGADNIVVFAIDPSTGLLTKRGAVRTGAAPRFFMIDASRKWLLAAGQDSNTITIFGIDPATGMLDPKQNPVNVPAPVFIGAYLYRAYRGPK
jgi:6-phosphogluconolactonase